MLRDFFRLVGGYKRTVIVGRSVGVLGWTVSEIDRSVW